MTDCAEPRDRVAAFLAWLRTSGLPPAEWARLAKAVLVAGVEAHGVAFIDEAAASVETQEMFLKRKAWYVSRQSEITGSSPVGGVKRRRR